MRLRVGRGSFTWDGTRYNAGDVLTLPDDDPRIGALQRLYGLEPAPARKTKKQTETEPTEETTNGISEA